MKAIHNKVNIVPVIAKADTLTLKERERLKKRVSEAGILLSLWVRLGGMGMKKGVCSHAQSAQVSGGRVGEFFLHFSGGFQGEPDSYKF